MPSPILPTIPAPIEFVFKTKTKSFSSEALSAKILTREIGGQRFELTLKYPPMSQDEFAAVEAFLTSRSKNDIFYVTVPFLSDQAGEQFGNMINFDNDTKLHKITALNPTVVYPPMRNVGGVILSDEVDPYGDGVNLFDSDPGAEKTSAGNIWYYDDVLMADLVGVKIGGSLSFSADLKSSIAGHNRFLNIRALDSGGGILSQASSVSDDNVIYARKSATLLIPAGTVKFDIMATWTGSAGTGYSKNAMLNRGAVALSYVPPPQVFLKCSRKNDIQSVKYSSDGFIRFEVDVVERT